MRHLSYVFIAAVIVGLLISNMICWNRIAKLENYHSAAEELLDTLENHYNWVDAIDSDNYYDATEQIK